MANIYKIELDRIKKKVKKQPKSNVENKLKTFAFKVTCLTLAQYYIEHAQTMGLTIDPELEEAFLGDYLTFGVDDQYDVSYVEGRKNVPTGTKVLTSEQSIEKELIEMAANKKILKLKKYAKKRTYREMALLDHASNYDSILETVEKPIKKKSKLQEIIVTESDHMIMINGNVFFKNPNDRLTNIIVSE